MIYKFHTEWTPIQYVNLLREITWDMKHRWIGKKDYDRVVKKIARIRKKIKHRYPEWVKHSCYHILYGD